MLQVDRFKIYIFETIYNCKENYKKKKIDKFINKTELTSVHIFHKCINLIDDI